MVIDCDVTMGELYRAKYAFKGLEDIHSVWKTNPASSTPSSPNSRTANDNNNKISPDAVLKMSKCFTKVPSQALLRSPVLCAKLEKCSSEPNVSKDVGAASETKTSPSATSEASACQSSKSEHSLAGISVSCFSHPHKNLFLAFEQGDLFEVLSKEENERWWAVRAVKSNAVGFVPANFLDPADGEDKPDEASSEKKTEQQKLVSDLRKRIGDVISQGAFFPCGRMIPEPELCTAGGDLEKRNQRNNGVPLAPPLPPHSPEGLILPRKPINPCLESVDHKNLHRELLFNQRIGKNVLNQKSELQRALEKHKEHQVKKELELQKQENKSALEKVIEERARRLETLEKSEEAEKCRPGEPEFMKVHAKLRARMDSK